MAFHLNQKITRLPNVQWADYDTNESEEGPPYGPVYTISALELQGGEEWLQVVEYVDPDGPDVWYSAAVWRPVVTRQTDISIFQALLTKAPELMGDDR